MRTIEPHRTIVVYADTIVTHKSGLAMVYQRKKYERGTIAIWRETISHDGRSFPRPRVPRRVLDSSK